MNFKVQGIKVKRKNGVWDAYGWMKHEIKGLVAHDNIKEIKQVKTTITKAKKLPQT
jgi:hypothetical protein